MIGNYSCSCSVGWKGNNCDIMVDLCKDSPCVHGTCINKENGYICSCQVGWAGAQCSVDKDECLSVPCLHQGRCFDSTTNEHSLGPLAPLGLNQAMFPLAVDAYHCACHAGYTGSSCETNIDDCASHPCMNGSTQGERSSETIPLTIRCKMNFERKRSPFPHIRLLLHKFP